jgi:hypothetical protein
MHDSMANLMSSFHPLQTLPTIQPQTGLLGLKVAIGDLIATPPPNSAREGNCEAI